MGVKPQYERVPSEAVANPGKQVQLTVIPDIEEKLHSVLVNFIQEFGSHTQPIAFLVGPLEFASMAFRAHHGRFARAGMLVEGLEFMGLPVRAKQTPGIELELPGSSALRFAAHLTQDKTAIANENYEAMLKRLQEGKKK